MARVVAAGTDDGINFDSISAWCFFLLQRILPQAKNRNHHAPLVTLLLLVVLLLVVMLVLVVILLMVMVLSLSIRHEDEAYQDRRMFSLYLVVLSAETKQTR